MKRNVIALLLFTALCASVFAQTGDDFEIEQNKSGGITITDYTGKITKVIIPSIIEGIKVTEIGNEAFHQNKNITSVTIPNGVTSIGYEAFYRCGSLASVTIPNSVIGIMNKAFGNCTSIASITIGANKNYASEFPNNFETYYDNQGKKAGTYTWSGRLWSVK